MRRLNLIIAFAALALSLPTLGSQPAPTVKIEVEADTVSTIHQGFPGFGYETSAVAQANYFTARNVRLLRLYGNLGRGGLIRIGGNVSDHTRFSAQAAPAAKTERDVTIINQQNLVDLGGFARAAGWKVMWGLNLGTGTREQAVDEAVAVQDALADRLHSFEIGNEVDLMRKFARDFEAYHAAYVEYKNAIRQRLPNSPFSGPDVAGNLAFVEKFIAAESSDVRLITHHYYRSGARNRNATMENLLLRDRAFDTRLEHLQALCAEHHLEYRINEVNSFSGGGKQGVSDTFASALWCLDFMFDVAAHGGSGVNMETDINQLGFISHYSPIVHDGDGVCSARPEYYALLAFSVAGHGSLFKTSVAGADAINLTAYATGEPGHVQFLTVINKDLMKDATIECAVPDVSRSVHVLRLVAASPDAKAGVTFGGAAVGSDGSWTPDQGETAPANGGVVHISIPHATAAVVKFE